MKLHRIRTKRDVLVLSLEEIALVLAVDSAGGIGPKPLDKVKVPGEALGRFTAQTAVMEVLAVGARPVSLAYSLCMELYPVGEEALKGIKKVASEVSLDPDRALVGSSEKNVTVDQSGLGICTVGLAKRKDLRIGKSRKGDIVVSIGLPSVGNEVLMAEAKKLTADIATLRRLLEKPYVREVIPAGSKGVLHEVTVIAEDSGLKLEPYANVGIDTRKSAGPATSLVASIQPKFVSKIYEVEKPVAKIGILI